MDQPCKDCRGAGRVRQPAKLTLKIPAGIYDGATLRIAGEGEAGIRGTAPGDLYVVVRVKKDPRFERVEDDLIAERAVDIAHAALGTTLEIQTIGGDSTRIKIAAGVQHGAKFRVRDQGMPKLHGRGRGDLIVQVRLDVPQELSARQRELLKSTSARCTRKARAQPTKRSSRRSSARNIINFSSADTLPSPRTFTFRVPRPIIRESRACSPVRRSLCDARALWCRRDGDEDGSVSGRSRRIRGALPKLPAAHLYQGLLKSSHWDFAPRKPRMGAFYHAAADAADRGLLREWLNQQERWSRVIMAAAKQCQRGQLPELRQPIEFRDAIRACADAKNAVTVVAWEGLCGSGAREPLGAALAACREQPDMAINLFIGPEGGFSDEEIELARAIGAVVFGMGPRILRAETAASAALAIVQYELGGV